jgi:hypothetical protein
MTETTAPQDEPQETDNTKIDAGTDVGGGAIQAEPPKGKIR